MGPRAIKKQKLFQELAYKENERLKYIEEEARRLEVEFRFPKRKLKTKYKNLDIPIDDTEDSCITFWSQHVNIR